jgi:hypothetical protein
MARKRHLIKQFIIFLLSLFISAALLSVILLVFNLSESREGEIILKNDIFQRGQHTLKDLTPAVVPHKNTKEPAMQETTLIDSSETDDNDRMQVDYYIIIGSFRDLKQAQQKAERLKNDFDTDIIVLPPTTEGNYRISYGKYSSPEEAKTKIKSIIKNINPDAWILSIKK